MRNYVKSSLELHIFFARIMKEHSFFLQAGFMPISNDYICEAQWYKGEFEKLLSEIVRISNCMICPEILTSGEVVTQYTLGVEKKTSELTGIPIDTSITLQQLRLQAGDTSFLDPNLIEYICCLNERALQLLDGLISLKERILRDVLSCKLFTVNYPLLLEHILREAKLYRQYVMMLQNGQNISCQDMKQVELFWNQIMMEHALFIRGLLDPTEEELINTADNFAKDYKKLLQEAQSMTDETINTIKDKTITETTKYRDFKKAGTEGIATCQIKSIIIPLLADHVLREANHYLRLLKE